MAELLVQPAQLSRQWQPQDGAASELARGCCDLRPTVDGTRSVEQAVTVLVDGELLVRDTRLR